MKKYQLNKLIKEEVSNALKDRIVPYKKDGYDEKRSLRAYQIANEIIKNQMDFPEDSIEDEKLFLATIKALTDKLYEKAADMFSSAGSAPDEY